MLEKSKPTWDFDNLYQKFTKENKNLCKKQNKSGYELLLIDIK